MTSATHHPSLPLSLSLCSLSHLRHLSSTTILLSLFPFRFFSLCSFPIGILLPFPFGALSCVISPPLFVIPTSLLRLAASRLPPHPSCLTRPYLRLPADRFLQLHRQRSAFHHHTPLCTHAHTTPNVSPTPVCLRRKHPPPSCRVPDILALPAELLAHSTHHAT